MLLVLILSGIFFHPILSCTSDPNCQHCEFHVVRRTRRGIQGYYYCLQCSANRTVDPVSGQCQCDNSYYQNSNQTCESCPSTCHKCSSSTYCTECMAQLLRQVKNGKCVCIEGYQEAKDSNICEQKRNILMMILSSIGSIGCLILSAVICAVLRYRRTAQVEIQNHKRKQSRRLDIEMYQEQVDTTSNMLFTSKFQFYKQNKTCSICLDEGTHFITDCGHYFHGKCLFSWIEGKNTCPNCNKELRSKDVRRWCEKCEKVLMPVIQNVLISKRKRREILKSMPIEYQICEGCEKSQKNQSSQEKEGL